MRQLATDVCELSPRHKSVLGTLAEQLTGLDTAEALLERMQGELEPPEIVARDLLEGPPSSVADTPAFTDALTGSLKLGTCALVAAIEHAIKTVGHESPIGAALVGCQSTLRHLWLIGARARMEDVAEGHGVAAAIFKPSTIPGFEPSSLPAPTDSQIRDQVAAAKGWVAASVDTAVVVIQVGP
jgi:hypothetical protein